jgi:hypothetical protein
LFPSSSLAVAAASVVVDQPVVAVGDFGKPHLLVVVFVGGGVSMLQREKTERELELEQRIRPRKRQRSKPGQRQGRSELRRACFSASVVGYSSWLVVGCNLLTDGF